MAMCGEQHQSNVYFAGAVILTGLHSLKSYVNPVSEITISIIFPPIGGNIFQELYNEST
jgi:hypothetical protein